MERMATLYWQICRWLESADGQLVNLFMDFETFGEHQWAETGIFFIYAENLVDTWSNRENHVFYTVTGAAAELEASGELSMPDTVTWADSERDPSAGTAMLCKRSSQMPI